jgi:hypothetical protein
MINKQFDIPSNCQYEFGAIATDPPRTEGDAALSNRPRGGVDVVK